MRDNSKRIDTPQDANAASQTETRTAGLSVLLPYIFSLWGFVVAQPIYTDLFKDGGYFRANQLPVADIWLAVLILSVLLPGCWILAFWLLNRFSPRLAKATGQVLIALLLGCFCMLLLRNFPTLPTLIKLTFSILSGIQLTRLLVKNRESAFLLYFAVPGALIFPTWFLLSCPLTTPFKFETADSLASPRSKTALETPVVMILFDELPLVSLLDEQGQIDAVNYPNFSALAQNATWYPNAVTVHSVTRGAVPAIMSGKYPPAVFDWGSLFYGRHQFNCISPLPTAESFPHTLFSLLEDTHSMQVFDATAWAAETGSPCNRWANAS